MAFFRVKIVRGKGYFFEVENRREGKRVRQHILNYLGPVEPVFGRFAYAPVGWGPCSHTPRCTWEGIRAQAAARTARLQLLYAGNPFPVPPRAFGPSPANVERHAFHQRTS